MGDLAPRAVVELLRGQPLTDAKVGFAWRAAVGPALARATAAHLARDGTLYVAADGEHWRRETSRSLGIIRPRVRRLLGEDAVKRIIVKGRH